MLSYLHSLYLDPKVHYYTAQNSMAYKGHQRHLQGRIQQWMQWTSYLCQIQPSRCLKMPRKGTFVGGIRADGTSWACPGQGRRVGVVGVPGSDPGQKKPLGTFPVAVYAVPSRSRQCECERLCRSVCETTSHVFQTTRQSMDL